ncbi:MAG: hypothetical protein OXH23_12400 [bacterium]|nr:hypothetical protein [bacterium]
MNCRDCGTHLTADHERDIELCTRCEALSAGLDPTYTIDDYRAGR